MTGQVRSGKLPERTPRGEPGEGLVGSDNLSEPSPRGDDCVELVSDNPENTNGNLITIYTGTRPCGQMSTGSKARRVTTDTLVTERDFQRTVLELARLTGWKTYHTHDSRRSEAGFPDLAMTRGGRVVFAELKSDKGKVSLAQREWLAALASCPGLEVKLWRPGDWDDVEYTLRRRP